MSNLNNLQPFHGKLGGGIPLGTIVIWPSDYFWQKVKTFEVFINNNLKISVLGKKAGRIPISFLILKGKLELSISNLMSFLQSLDDQPFHKNRIG